MNEQQKVSEAVARVTADLERGVYLTRTIQNNPRPVAYVLIDDVRTILAELDQLRQRVAELELLNRQLRQDFDNAAWEAEAKLALAETDARRYRWLRDNAASAPGNTPCPYRWTNSDVPETVNGDLLDSEIDAAMRAAIDAGGHDSLPPHKGGVD